MARNRPSTLKLGRINLKSLEALNKDPTAVQRSMDAYSAPKADFSARDNSLRNAKAIQSLRGIIDDVPALVGVATDMADDEAFEAWQLKSKDERDKYREQLKVRNIGPWHSPFFNASMQKLAAADNAVNYNGEFQIALQEERLKERQNGTTFDFDTWRIDWTRTWADEHGMAGVSPAAYSIFAKGIAGVHNQAIAERSQARVKQMNYDHQQKFRNGVGLILSGVPEEVPEKIAGFLQEHVIDVNGDMATYMPIVRDALAEKAIEAEQADGRGLAWITAAGNMNTGGTTKDGKPRLWKETPQFKIWKRKTLEAGDRAAASRLAREEARIKNENNETWRNEDKYRKTWLRKETKDDKSLGATDAAMKRFFKETPEGQQQLQEAYMDKHISGAVGTRATDIINMATRTLSPDDVRRAHNSLQTFNGTPEEALNDLVENHGLGYDQALAAVNNWEKFNREVTGADVDSEITKFYTKGFNTSNALAVENIDIGKRKAFMEPLKRKFDADLSVIIQSDATDEDKRKQALDLSVKFSGEVTDWKATHFTGVQVKETKIQKAKDAENEVLTTWIPEDIDRAIEFLNVDVGSYGRARKMKAGFLAKNKVLTASQRAMVLDEFKQSRQWQAADKLGISVKRLLELIEEYSGSKSDVKANEEITDKSLTPNVEAANTKAANTKAVDDII
jgi:hypothetical protein